MLCGCFAARGPGALVKMNGMMNSTKYQDILGKYLVPFARKLGFGHRWAFQKDNDPKNTSQKLYLFSTVFFARFHQGCI